MYKIFIVEDDETIAHSIADRLSSWGFESNVCNNFRNILTQFLEIEPHLVLMDISLPFFNGYHWCSEISKNFKGPYNVHFFRRRQNEYCHGHKHGC